MPSWDNPSALIAPSSAPSTFFAPFSSMPRALFTLFSLLGAVYFARRNLRMGRGDRRGATRQALFFFSLLGIEFIFRDHFGSIYTLLVTPVVFWLMYIALEPFVRRRWPGMLIGWSRLLAGNFRDPLVGRNLLVGCAGGIVLAMLPYLGMAFASLLNAPQERPYNGATLGLDTLYLFSSARAIVVGIS